MYRLSRVGQDMMGAAFVLLACLGLGQPAFAAGPPAVDTPISDFSVPENSPPSAVIDLQSVFRDGNGPFTYSVVANSNSSLVTTTLSNGTRDLTLSYAPNASGVATITVEVMDADSATADDTFTVTVTPVVPVNNAPTADAQGVAATEDSAAAITLTGSDPDSDPLTFAIVSGPANGTLTGTLRI